MSCSKAMKRSHDQTFKDEYSATWPVLKRSKKSENRAYCTVCCSEFSVAHGGKADCKRHVEGSRHVERAKSIAHNQIITDKFVSKSEDLSVIRAEGLFASFLIEHNIPLAASDHAGSLFKKMFPDSKIAAKYGSGRTKTSAIVRSFGASTAQQITEKMRTTKFSLATDGSNSRENEKLFPLLVNYFDGTARKIVTMLLSVLSLPEDATGANIFSLLDQELARREVPWTNCMAFCSDNAPVMVGRVKGVVKYIKEKNPSVIPIGCACHWVHNTARNAAKKLGVPFEDAFVDVYYYLNRSAKRSSALKMYQLLCGEEAQKIIKHVPTRWLSLSKVVSRFLEQLEPLKRFFASECENGPTKKCSEINEFLTAPTTELHLMFLEHVLPLFTKTNTNLQHESPTIHKLHRELTNLFSEMLSRFVKPSAVVEAKNVLSIKFHEKNVQKSRDDLVIGSKARKFLSTDKLSAAEKMQFYQAVRGFYVGSCDYMVKNFPFHDEVLKHAEVADIHFRCKSKFSSLRFFMSMLNFSDEEMDTIEAEFSSFQVDNLTEEILTCQRIDEAWVLISEIRDHNGSPKYSNLAKLMLQILVIPHSNASCERIFSTLRKNQNEFRVNMNLPTLEALAVVKSRMSAEGTVCYQQHFSDENLVNAKKATYLSFQKQ